MPNADLRLRFQLWPQLTGYQLSLLLRGAGGQSISDYNCGATGRRQCLSVSSNSPTGLSKAACCQPRRGATGPRNCVGAGFCPDCFVGNLRLRDSPFNVRPTREGQHGSASKTHELVITQFALLIVWRFHVFNPNRPPYHSSCSNDSRIANRPTSKLTVIGSGPTTSRQNLAKLYRHHREFCGNPHAPPLGGWWIIHE